MAAPHVSATAALVIASRVIGARPTPRAIQARLKATATDVGRRARTRATAPGSSTPPRPPRRLRPRRSARRGFYPSARARIWLWMQVAIVLCVLASAVIAVVKLYL